MTKYYGRIGFIEIIEKEPGVWVEKLSEERYYKGDIIRNLRRWNDNSNSINDDITVNNSISIIADSYFINHFPFIKYAEFMGSFWKVSSIDATNKPRIVLELGGVYNKRSDEDSESSEKEEAPIGPNVTIRVGER